MTDEPLQVAYARNPSQRTPCVLLIDTSGSMAGAPIAEVNAGLKLLESELKSDEIARVRVQIMLIEFGGAVTVRQNWVDADQFIAPTLSAAGGTPLGEAADRAITELQNVKRELNNSGVPYTRPWVFIMTDGAPTDTWEPSADRMRDAIADKHLLLFPFAVSGATPENLAKFQQPGQPVYHEIPRDQFRDLFKWLSNSMATTSKAAPGQGAQIALPPGQMMTVPT
ncbi:MAG: VWA domain-containing protein [Verrucomicrobiaceae bacterium]|nr:MAG: VWA domain-containing protein [Verrucomicrobiaceae bacterium]